MNLIAPSLLGLIAVVSAAVPAMAAEVPAVLQWSRRVELSVPVAGVVQRVNADVGDPVRRGQVLVSLHAGAQSAQVSESNASALRAREELAEAKRDLGRTQELFDRTVIATTELDQAKLRYARASAQAQEAHARVRHARELVGDYQIRAPFDGIVVARNVEPGQAVSGQLQPAPLMVLAKAGEMVAKFAASVDQANALRRNQSVTVIANGKSYPGRIARVGWEPLAANGPAAYPLEAVFPVSPLLRAGSPAKVIVP